MLLNFNDSQKILERYEIPLVDSRVIGNEEELLEALNELGQPVVMKIDPDTKESAHKTELGGVKVNLTNPEEAKQALSELLEIEPRIIVQKQISGEEIIIGGQQDEVFGPTVMFGLGGVLVEIYEDIVFRLAPIDLEEARMMIEEIRGKQLLEGFRGREPVNKESLADILVKTGRLLAEEEQIRELDFNPIIGTDQPLVCDVKLIQS